MVAIGDLINHQHSRSSSNGTSNGLESRRRRRRSPSQDSFSSDAPAQSSTSPSPTFSSPPPQTASSQRINSASPSNIVLPSVANLLITGSPSDPHHKIDDLFRRGTAALFPASAATSATAKPLFMQHTRSHSSPTTAIAPRLATSHHSTSTNSSPLAPWPRTHTRNLSDSSTLSHSSSSPASPRSTQHFPPHHQSYPPHHQQQQQQYSIHESITVPSHAFEGAQFAQPTTPPYTPPTTHADIISHSPFLTHQHRRSQSSVYPSNQSPPTHPYTFPTYGDQTAPHQHRRHLSLHHQVPPPHQQPHPPTLPRISHHRHSSNPLFTSSSLSDVAIKPCASPISPTPQDLPFQQGSVQEEYARHLIQSGHIPPSPNTFPEQPLQPISPSTDTALHPLPPPPPPSTSDPSSAQKPYTCPLCHRPFSRIYNLRSHMDRHTTTKTYPCPSCPAIFSRSHDLARHILTHTRERPWGCDRCGRRFARRDALRRHDKVLDSGVVVCAAEGRPRGKKSASS